jgi:uncharacterized protein YjbJ (UPF0337 family)
MAVNWAIAEGHWQQTKGGLQEEWGRLMNHDLTFIAGRRAQQAAKLLQRYGVARQDSDRRLMRPGVSRLAWLGLGLVTAMPLLFAPAATSAESDIVTESGAAPAASTWDQIESNWVVFKGLVKEQWGKLTDDDLKAIHGERAQLIGRIQSLYGISLEEAESQVTTWENSVVAP